MKKVIYKNKTIAEIHSHIDLKECINTNPTSQKLVVCLTRNILVNSTGYAGFLTRDDLCTSLLSNLFGTQTKLNDDFVPFQFHRKEILSRVEKIIKKTYQYLPSTARTRIYIFPIFRSFVKERLHGVGGFVPRRNTLHLYIYPNSENKRLFFQAINHTVAHEYNHTVRFQYHQPALSSTLLDKIINEGLAENFRMQIIGGALSSWAAALQYKETKSMFKQIQPLLNSIKRKDDYDIFFADKKYPLWTGYAIGYQIVKSFFKKKPEAEWKKIMKLSSQKILEGSDFKISKYNTGFSSSTQKSQIEI